MQSAWIVCFLLLCTLLPRQAAGDLVTIDAAKDNTLFETSSDYTSNGIGEGIFSGATFSDGLRRGLVAFDIASVVPAGATITSVLLEMNVSRSLAGVHSSALHRLTSDWGEADSNSNVSGGGMGAPASPGDATWMHTFFDTQDWTTAGGDFVATASASIDIDDNGPVVWGSTPQMVADVQGWLDAPETNFGWIIRTQEGTLGSAKRFDSREISEPSLRPVLRVEYAGTAVRWTTWSATKALFR